MAAEALNGVADNAPNRASKNPTKSRRRGDEIGKRNKMDEPRQPKILFVDIEMRGHRFAKAGRKTPLTGHNQRYDADRRRA